jgi:hypothetical protein
LAVAKKRWVEVTPTSGDSVQKQSLISIRPNTIAFSAQFILSNDLRGMKRVRLFLDSENREIGFVFLREADPSIASYALTQDGGSGETNSRAIGVAGLMADNEWIRAVAAEKDRRVRKFAPKWDATTAPPKWVISLCPAFETRVTDKSEIASGTRGIYRYRQGRDVVYIGRGQVRSRASAPERREWEFETIEYTEIASNEAQEKWEAFWLDAYVQENCVLPRYNRVAGKKGGD